jgi:hypothetical protein
MVDGSLPRLGEDEGGYPTPPSRTEGSGAVCPRPPDGRGQIERETWQGEASGLGTLSPGPPPLPPLKDSLLLLALPFLGGRAVGFSRGPWSLVGLVGPLVGLLLPISPFLGIGGAEIGRCPGAVRGGLMWPELGRLQSFLYPCVVAEEVCK